MASLSAFESARADVKQTVTQVGAYVTKPQEDRPKGFYFGTSMNAIDKKTLPLPALVVFHSL